MQRQPDSALHYLLLQAIGIQHEIKDAHNQHTAFIIVRCWCIFRNNDFLESVAGPADAPFLFPVSKSGASFGLRLQLRNCPARPLVVQNGGTAFAVPPYYLNSSTTPRLIVYSSLFF